MSPQELLANLISFPTVSRDSNKEITDFLDALLKSWGAVCERIEYTDSEGVHKSNLIAKLGTGYGGLAYCCHTDVVPADTWNMETSPFELVNQDQKYYGRGSCDMKGSIATFLSALQSRLDKPFTHPVYFIATADEEVGYKGAARIVEKSALFHEMEQHDTHSIIGEPTECNVVYAHKGVCGLKITSQGIAAHSSTNLGKNANLPMIPFLQEMKLIYDESVSNIDWMNLEFDPPEISYNIGINDYTYARNITPGISICTIFFRPVPGFDVESLISRVKQTAEKFQLEFELESLAYPMSRPADSDYVRQSLLLSAQESARTVSYGTDGAMFKNLKNLIVLGPGSIMQAHTDNEFITEDQLQKGAFIYGKFIDHYCITESK